TRTTIMSTTGCSSDVTATATPTTACWCTSTRTFPTCITTILTMEASKGLRPAADLRPTTPGHLRPATPPAVEAADVARPFGMLVDLRATPHNRPRPHLREPCRFVFERRPDRLINRRDGLGSGRPWGVVGSRGYQHARLSERSKHADEDRAREHLVG